MNYSPCPCSYVLWTRRRLHPVVQKAFISHSDQQNCLYLRLSPDLTHFHQSGADRDEDVRETDRRGEGPVTLDWPVIAVNWTLCAVFLSRHQYSAHNLLNTANGASEDWQDWVCLHTELNYPQNEATSPETSSPTCSLPLLHFICVLSRIHFASLFPVFKIHDILWFNNWIAFKACIMRMLHSTI